LTRDSHIGVPHVAQGGRSASPDDEGTICEIVMAA
jgi:hypothetical protein